MLKLKKKKAKKKLEACKTAQRVKVLTAKPNILTGFPGPIVKEENQLPQGVLPLSLPHPTPTAHRSGVF